MSCLNRHPISTLIKLLLISYISMFFVNARAESTQEDIVRTSLTANFIRFTTWPDKAKSTQSHQIHLCLVGDSALEEAFSGLSTKTINDKTLEVSYLTRFNNLENCQLLYISNLEKNRLNLLLDEIKNLPILTIGEDDVFVKTGGMISIQIIDGKVKITINLKATKKSNLNISARVLKLATIIE